MNKSIARRYYKGLCCISNKPLNPEIIEEKEMLLRSSSTPVLGSLLSSFSESPNNNHHYSDPHTTAKRPPIPPILNNHKKLSIHQTRSLNFTHSCNSSPISPSIDAGVCSHNGIRRAQSEGNLEALANTSCNNDEFSISNPPKKFSRRPNCSMLQPIPSFSFHNSTGSYEDEDRMMKKKNRENNSTKMVGYLRIQLEVKRVSWTGMLVS
ncbi:hypothetical protein F0562_002387 [Nyssa sinensis]|uniref:Uncharacterized protein n=1 Tax=Nyssa sinensis TaxID=561372 RepID=A0A5J5C5R4_9ASTE|nr:hypothetical protein F0562_002387 [Nyssa sinensis]